MMKYLLIFVVITWPICFVGALLHAQGEAYYREKLVEQVWDTQHWKDIAVDTSNQYLTCKEELFAAEGGNR